MSTDNKSLENKQPEDILAESGTMTGKATPQGIIIGGTNLITGSKDYTGWINNNNPEIIPNAYKNFTAYRKLGSYGSRYYSKKIAEANDTITVSFYAKYISGGVYTIVFMNGNSIQKYVYFPANPTVGTWYRLSVTTTVNVDIYSLKIEEAHPYVGIEFCAIKLELGNIPTDWSPAPEDVENKIALEINKIQIGGRNLAKNSTSYVGWRKNLSDLDINASTGVITLASNGSEKFILPTEGTIMGYAGQQYTASYKVKCENLDKGLMIPIYHDGKWQPAHYTYIDIKDTKGDWIIISKTFTPKNSGAISFAIDNYRNTTGIIYAKEGKLELGNKPSDWTPAPEDSTYEEGTWTPVVEGSSTQGVAQYTVNNARYVRTGNMITTFFDTSGKFTTAPTGACVIKGLPYQGDNNTNGLITLGIGYAEQNVYFTIQGNTLVSKKQNGKNSDIVAASFGTDISNTSFHLYGNVSYFIG